MGARRATVGSGVLNPTGVAVDGAGDVLIADTGHSQLVEVPVGGGAQTTVASGLLNPAGVAVDGEGNVFIVDTSNSRVAGFQRSEPPTLSFASTAVGNTSSDSPQSVTLQNIGNQLLDAVPPGLVLGANFIQVTGSGTPADCTANFSLPPGVTCNVSFSFTPKSVGSIQSSAAFTDNSLNSTAAVQTVVLDGVGTQASQTITFGALSNQTYGTPPPTLSAMASSGLAVSFASTTMSVCTISGTTVTVVAAGTCTIQATQAGNATYAAAIPVNQSFQITQESQTITFGTLSNRAYATAPFTVSATASSGLAVSFASATTSVCTVSGTTVTLVAVGTCTIQATQAGNVDYAAALPVNQSFYVTSKSQTITFNTLSNRAYGTAPFTVSATASSKLAVSFASTTTADCTVSGTTVTLVAVGTCTIQATQAGNVTYAAAMPVNQSFQITQESQTITFGTLSNRVYGTAPFTVNATASSGLAVSFASTTTSLCTVSGTTVTLVAVGTCTIQATQAGNADYAAASPVNRSFSVTKASQTITFGALSNQAYGTAPFTVNATASSGLAVSFASTTTSVCTVSGTTVTLVALGTCTIEATQAGNADYTSASAVNRSFSVTKWTQTITFGALSNQAYGTAPFTVSATASSKLAVSFASATSAVCTVSGTTVTLVAVGTCTIQATQAGNTNYAAASPVNQSFQVTQGGQTITFGALSNQPFGIAPFTVSATASSGLAVSFASATTSVCTVSGTTVTLVAVGTCTIQVTQAGNTNYAAASPVSQSFQVTQGSQTITFGALSNQPFGIAPFTVSATASSKLAVSFASATSSVCTVSGATVTLVAVGTCTIQATQVGNASYAAATPVNQSFQVAANSQTITFGSLSNQVYGTAPFTVSAAASSGLAVSFASTTTSVCTISGTTVTLVAVGTCTIQATQVGNASYAAAPPVNQSFQVISNGTVNTPTYVQSADCSELDGDPITAASSTFNCRFPQPTLGGSGDGIVCGFVNDDVTTPGWSLSDGSNAYTYVTKTDTSNNEILVTGYTVNDTSVQNITFTSGSSSVALRGPWCGEWTGIGGGFDQSSSGNNASSTTVTAGTTTPAVTGELIVQQAYNEYIGGYSAGASTFSAGSQSNITWNLYVHDSFVPMAVQAGVYSSTSAINPTMAETTSGFVSQALFFKPGTGPAVPSGLWVNSLKHIWLQSFSSPATISFPCPATDNVAFYQFTGNPNGPDDTTAITINSNSMTQTYSKTTVGTSSNLHNYYIENQPLSPNQNLVITGTFSGANAMAYCFTSSNAASSFQSSNVPAPTTGNQGNTSSTLGPVISITPNFSGDLLFVVTAIANNTTTGLTGSGQYFMDEFWSNSVGNSGQLDQGNGFGFMLAPNTSPQSWTYNLYFTTSDAVGDWVAETDEFH